MQGYNWELPAFLTTNQISARGVWRPPPFWFIGRSMIKMHGARLWNQGDSLSVTGSISIGLDKDGEYAAASNYPQSEDTMPLLNTTIITKHFPTNDRDSEEYYPEPIELYERDAFIIGIEFIPNGAVVYPLLNFLVDPFDTPYGPKTKLALRGRAVGGINVVRDWSDSNHQIQAVDVVASDDPVPPAAPGAMVFNGTSSYLTFRDRILDFQWYRYDGASTRTPRPFKFSTGFRTSDCSLSGGQYRTIFVGSDVWNPGAPPTNYYNETVTPFYVAMDSSGHVIAGTPTSYITSSGVYADGIAHQLEIERDGASQITMKVDGALVAGPTTDTRLYSIDKARIGRSTTAGYWNGEITGFTVEKG